MTKKQSFIMFIVFAAAAMYLAAQKDIYEELLMSMMAICSFVMVATEHIMEELKK